MRRTQTAIIISSITRQEQERLEKGIETIQTLTAKDSTRTVTSMALITGIQKGIEEELFRRIRQGNNDLDTTLEDAWETKLRLVESRNYRNI